MKSKIIISLSVAAIVMITALIWLTTNHNATLNSNNHGINTSTSKPTAPTLSIDTATVQTPPQMAIRKPTPFSSSNQAVTAITSQSTSKAILKIGKPVAFETVRQKLWLPVSEQEATDRMFLLYDIHPLYAKQVGDKVSIEADKFGINYTGTITQIEQVDDDIQRWIGNFDGIPSDRYHFRITQSQQDNYALATLYTQKGIYELESKDGVGWVRPSQPILNDGLHHDAHHTSSHDDDSSGI